MTKKNIIVLASGNGSNLQALINSSTKHDYIVSAVISDNIDAYALTRASENKIPALCLDPKEYANKSIFEAELAKVISYYPYELIVLAGFMRILSPIFLNQFPNKIINLHPSLLPKHKGLNTHSKAISAQDSFHGASVHIVNEILDGGQILIRGKTPLTSSNIAAVAKKVKVIEHKILPLTVQLLINKQLYYRDSQLFFKKIPLSVNGLTITFTS